MTFSDFKHLVASQPDGVVLLEGRRLISPEDYERATKFARYLATQFDTIGHSDAFPKPLCALFYVWLDDPMEGGTGHTIRVCHQEGVPVAFQDSWTQWTEE